MDDTTLERFEALLAEGQNNPLLRLSVGQAYVDRGNGEKAAEHLRAALERDPNYTAAWKWLAKALESLNQTEAAADAYRQGIEVARVKGDKQLQKEMEVFLKRLDRITG